MERDEQQWVRRLVGPDLDDSDVRYLCDRMERVAGGPGHTLIARGARGDAMYLVLQGSLSVHVPAAGERLELATVGPGGWVGELHFVEPGPAAATVSSATDFVVMRLPSNALPEMIDDNPHAASSLLRVLLRVISDRLVATGDSVTGEGGDDAARRESSDADAGWWGRVLRRAFAREAAS